MRDYEILSLRGRVNGTARLYAERRGAAAEFALRGRAKPGAVFFVDAEGRVAEGRPAAEEGRYYTELGSVCGTAVFDRSGALLCSGALGRCGSVLKSKLPELRMRAYRPSSEAKKAEGSEERGAPVSPVTEDIIKRAKRLFVPAGAEDESASGIMESAEPADAGAYAIPNPFPITYPNSYWQGNVGTTELMGTAMTPSGKLELRAVPAKHGMRRMGYGRYLIDVNGRGYLVRERPYKG